MNKEYAVYLNDIMGAISKIENFISDLSLEEFRQDIKTQDAVIRNFEVIGEAVKRIPDDFKKKYPEMPWRSAGDMRDFLIHDYPDIIPDVVWKTATEDLPKFKRQIIRILEK